MVDVAYLTYDQILLIHSIAIDESGGSHGVRDRRGLLTVRELPKQAAFGQELYPTLFDKAAVYARNILMAHPFVDGNKRAAIACASIFLENNGHVIIVEKGGIEKYAMHIVRKKPELAEIAAWFEQNTKEL